MRRIECNLWRGAASTPHTDHNKEVEGYMQKIRQVLGTLHTSRQSLGKDYTTTGATSPLSSQALCRTLINLRFFLNYDATARGRLLRRKFALRELPSIIDTILSSSSEGETIRCLPVSNAQAFIDVVDEVRSTGGLLSY